MGGDGEEEGWFISVSEYALKSYALRPTPAAAAAALYSETRPFLTLANDQGIQVQEG